MDNDRFLVGLDDDLAVEAVYYGSGTLCLSSQAGCAVGCPFCASGARGLLRNLTVPELHRQLQVARQRGHRPLRLTLSGIGEPLHNAAAVRQFLADCAAMQLPLSLTTSGGPLATLQEFLRLPHNGLMLSLHAGSAATHRRLLPHGPDFDGLWRVLAEQLPSLSRRKRRRLGINYLLLQGVNDHQAELAALGERLRAFPDLTLHLLSCNPVPGQLWRSPGPETMDRVHGLLSGYGLNVRRPNRWRIRQEGGCGTLVLHGAATAAERSGLGRNVAPVNYEPESEIL